jgi:ribosomal protein L37AE/L43A
LTKKTCADCGRSFHARSDSKRQICIVCEAEHEMAGVNPNEKQPADKGEYKPRYNGMSPFEGK